MRSRIVVKDGLWPSPVQRGVLLALGLALASLVGGCNSEDDSSAAPASESNVTTGSSERDLFANKYAVKDRKPADAKSPDFQDLELDKNGQYAALVLSSRVGLNGMCISEDTAGESAPCWLSERGQWSISAGDGATTLKLSPTAQPSRSYTAALEGDTFKLTRQGRVTELLKR